MNEAALQPKRTGLLIWMIVSQILAVVSLVPWLLMAGLSVMAFDQGSTPEAWTFVIAVWSYPVLPIILVIAAWIAYAKHRNRAAGILSGLSFAPPLLCIAVIWFSNALWFAQNGGLDSFRP